MTQNSGKPLSSKTANAACGGPQGGGMDSRRNDGAVAEASAQYLAQAAGHATPASHDCPPGYKRTEVGVIPEDWEATTIGHVTKWLSGGTPNRKIEKYWQGNIPWISGSTLKSLELRTSDQFLSEEGVDAGSKMAPVNSTLLLVRGSALHSEIRAGLVVKPVCFNQDVKALIPKKEIYPKYLTLYILAMNDELLKLVSSAGNSAGVLDTELVKNFKFFQPSRKEQTAIANALSDVDALISELEKLIAKKQAIKTATMQQLLTGRTRMPQFALREDGTPKGYKQSELGEIPEDWDAIKMGDLARIQRGASPRPIDSPIWFDRNSTVGWLRISDVSKTNKYLTETTQSLSELGIANSRFVPKLNLVMSICATVGKPIITKKDLCIHDGFVVFNGLSVNQDFMYYILKELEDEWSKQGQTGSQMNLNTDLINGTYVAVPKDDTEQTAIATILSDMDEEIQALQQRLAKTRQIKQGMMQELLTGKTRLVKPE
ncbi:restriction endonuclease subunit S [Granulosicoccaceae sp. 1_MG-2023]|nr:restriction endonuclease subunit S [Granulosicoccaceae sp. 1_MG-2023]